MSDETKSVESMEEDLGGEIASLLVCTAVGWVNPYAGFVCGVGAVVKDANDEETQKLILKARKYFNDNRVNLASPRNEGGKYLSEITLQQKADNLGGTVWRLEWNTFWHPDVEFKLPSMIPSDDIFRSRSQIATLTNPHPRRNRDPGGPKLRQGP